MKTIVIIGSVMAMCGLASGSLLVEMDFNDANGNQSLVNRGSVSATGAFEGGGAYSSTYAPINGGGYSGNFDNGSLSKVNLGNLSELDALQSFTIAGWVNLATAPTGTDHLLGNYTHPSGFLLSIDVNRKIVLRVDGTAKVSSAVVPLNDWLFIAATYDGTATANNVIFFAGTTEANLAQKSVSSINKGATGTVSGNLYVGGYTSANTQFQGLMDNVRIYGSTTDATGALNITALKPVLAATDVIPEPATLGLIGFASVSLLWVRRRLSL